MTSGDGVVVWLTGLPSSGKSTLALRVRNRLRRPAVVLDSDALRDLLELESYTAKDRDRFYRVLANLAASFARQGFVVLVAATAHRRLHREHARRVAPRFVEVWVATPLDECTRRDVKGLYAKAHAGTITSLPGVDLPYDPPREPDVTATGGLDDAAVIAIQQLVE